MSENVKKGPIHMTESAAEARFEIVNNLGLHARAATKLVQLASRFACDIEISREGQKANAKSVMGVLLAVRRQRDVRPGDRQRPRGRRGGRRDRSAHRGQVRRVFMIGAKGRRGSGTMAAADEVPAGSDGPSGASHHSEGDSLARMASPSGPRSSWERCQHAFVRRTVKPARSRSRGARVSAKAVARAQDGIRLVVERMKSRRARAETSILDAYVQMLGDEMVAEGVERNIRINRQNAEWAVSNAIQELCDKFEDMEDPYLVERRHDVAFVGERFLRALSGSDKVAALPKLARPSVILAHDLSPADTAALVKEPVVAIITEVGTRTSHTSIMARALEIPAVVGVADALGRIRSGRHRHRRRFPRRSHGVSQRRR